MKKTTKLSVNIHDSTQLEAILNYDFSSSRDNLWARMRKYDVDVYLFFPPQLNINKQSYSKEDFYEDIRPLARLKEPNYEYEDFLPSQEKGRESPFDFLLKQYESLDKGQENLKDPNFISELKILACSLSSYVSRQTKEVSRDLKGFARKDNTTSEAETFFENSSKELKKIFFLFKAWQELYLKINESTEERFLDIQREVSLLDENVLGVFYRGVSNVFYGWEKDFSFIETESAKIFHRRLKAWILVIRAHYRLKNYFFLTEESTIQEKENFSMRLSYLKKRMWQVLYLEVKDKASFFKKRQLAYIAAAGFAALWALLANIFMWRQLNFQGTSSFFDATGGGSLGVGTTYFLVLTFVSAYILKDRIKDFARDKFQGGIFRHLPDSTEQIWYNNKITKKKFSIGTIYESQHYVDGLESVPLEIQAYRTSLFKGRFIEQEDIIHYHKKIILDTKKIWSFGQNLTAIHDIIRLSVKRYITRLDDPEEKNFILTKDGSIKMSTLPKVYYIDLVIKFSHKSLFSRSEEVLFECRRLILNKDGLVRILGS